MQDLNQKKLIAAALKKLQNINRDIAFDANVPDSRPTKTQQQIFDAVQNSEVSVIAAKGGNQSGKSAVGARLVTWLLQENFPEWEKPARWTEPLLILVLARTLKQAEESLWRKMEPFLEPGSYKVSRVGGIISKVTHLKTNNVMLFFSHDNANEARERVQSFTANFAWIDELPKNVKLIEEVSRRVQAKNGQVLLTFTPKSPAPDITRYVDTLEPPYGKVYTLLALDNPVYTDEDKQKLLESLKSFSENYRNTVLRGDWLQPDEMVYDFNYETMVMAPPDYSPSWRHVEASDPALSSAHGLIVAAENPSTGLWYIIKADYLKNILVPDKLVDEVMRRTSGLNVVRRVADPHETWYIQTANQKGMSYVVPYKKHERKPELIKNLQQALGTRLFIAPWCQDLIDELTSCHWSEAGTNKIVKASRFHLCDSSQYLVDCLPKYDGKVMNLDYWAELRLGNENRKKREEAVRTRKAKPYTPRRIRRTRKW